MGAMAATIAPVSAHRGPAALTIDATSCVRGEWRAPGSKSIAQRALLLAALAQGETRIAGLPRGADVACARELVRSVGVVIDDLAPAAVRIVGRPPSWRGGWRASTVEVGESGTLARFALAVLGFCGQPGLTVEIHASGSLLARRSDALLQALSDGGVVIERADWPVRLRPIGPPSTAVLREASSSQEASALALALAAYPDENELVIEGDLPSRPYFELTLAMLKAFSARVLRVPEAPPERWRFRGPLVAPNDPLTIEPDASLAAVALSAACLSGGELRALGLDASSAQGDVRVVEHLRAFGCRAISSRGALCASGFPQHGADIDLHGEPDLAPPLAIVAAGAALVAPSNQTRSVLRGLGALNHKESRRLDVLASELTRAGWTCRVSPNSLEIDAPHRPLSTEPLLMHPRNDHRMAFAFSLLGLLRTGVLVEEPQCVAKSWPSYWADMTSLGLRAQPVE